MKKTLIRCNNCMSVFIDEKLEIIGDMRACPNCKTDSFLMDLEEKGIFWCDHYYYLPFTEEDLKDPCTYCKENAKRKAERLTIK